MMTINRKIIAFVVLSLLAAMAVTVACAESSRTVSAAMPSFTEIPTGTNVGSYSTVDMADVNNDSYAEILSGSGQSDPQGLYVWTYDGSSWSNQTVSPVGYYAGVHFADITGDGTPDIVASAESSWSGNGTISGVRVWKTALSGTSMSWTPLPSPYTAHSCDGIAVGDVNGDSHTDIAVGTNGGGGVKVFINGGDGTSWTTVDASTGDPENTGVALSDLNGDGRLDVVATNYVGENATVMLCSAGGAVSYGTPHTNGLDTGTAYGIAVADFNKDSKPDLAIATQAYGVKVYYGNGCSGNDTTWWTDANAPFTAAGDNMQVSVGDIDKDGNKDIAVATPEGIWVLQNDGGSFSKVSVAGLPAGVGCYGCCLYDWDGDGDLDIAVCGWGFGVHFYKNGIYTPEFDGGFVAMLGVCGMMYVSVLAIVGRDKKL